MCIRNICTISRLRKSQKIVSLSLIVKLKKNIV